MAMHLQSIVVLLLLLVVVMITLPLSSDACGFGCFRVRPAKNSVDASDDDGGGTSRTTGSTATGTRRNTRTPSELAIRRNVSLTPVQVNN
ncbi:hypothetical protein GPALN_012022 [Globodera pallida]|nr:hypothetical protein GPALN_012022 [Globodera pallida]